MILNTENLSFKNSSFLNIDSSNFSSKKDFIEILDIFFHLISIGSISIISTRLQNISAASIAFDISFSNIFLISCSLMNITSETDYLFRLMNSNFETINFVVSRFSYSFLCNFNSTLVLNQSIFNNSEYFPIILSTPFLSSSIDSINSKITIEDSIFIYIKSSGNGSVLLIYEQINNYFR